MSSVAIADQLSISLSGVSVQYHLVKGRRKRLSLKDTVVHFGRNRRAANGFFALSNVHLQVKAAEIVGVIGRNGAGKSTLLAVVSGVLKPVTGVVAVQGRVAPLLAQGSAFDLELTGRENVYLNAALLGFTRKETDARYDEIVSFAEIQDFIDAPYKTFSSGMGARLGFAVASAAEADILLVDEVLAVGDVRFRKKCEERINRFRERKMTILYVSHDMDTVQELCTRVVWLERGRIVEDGEPAAVVPHYLDFMARR